MRTRLARLLLAAARRLDREGCVVPEGATRSVEIQPVPKPDLERFRAEVDRMAGVIARSQDLPENVFRRPRPSGGAILSPPSRSTDSVPVKLSEGEHWPCSGPESCRHCR